MDQEAESPLSVLVLPLIQSESEKTALPVWCVLLCEGGGCTVSLTPKPRPWVFFMLYSNLVICSSAYLHSPPANPSQKPLQLHVGIRIILLGGLLSVSLLPQFSLYARAKLMFLECCSCLTPHGLKTSHDSQSVYPLHPGQPFPVKRPSVLPNSTFSTIQPCRSLLQLRK